MQNTPIPERMQHLDVDWRGYAVPWGVVRDPDGVPLFAVNDEVKRWRMIRDDLCSICGQTLFRGRWFIGGPLSAFHQDGFYLDPPMHNECAHYALQTCPYLSALLYSHKTTKEDVARKLKNSHQISIDPTTIPDRPILFVAVMAVKQEGHRNGQQIYLRPLPPYRRVEYWRHGKRLAAADAEPIIDAMIGRDNRRV